MKFHHALPVICLCLCPFAMQARVTENFDAGWRFLRADAPGAEAVKFADGGWRRLSLPHDWSIEGPFSKTNRTGGAGAFLPAGVAWYRKHFTLPKSDTNKCVSIEFDGVMQNSDVWINGQHLGHRPYGYVSFACPLNGHLHFGGDNVIAARCDTSEQPASRWYSGAGIYRHVRLVVTDPVHIEHWGVFVSTPDVSAAKATVNIQTAVTNETTAPQNISVRTIVLSPDGKPVASVETDAEIPGTARSANTNSIERAGTVPGAPVTQKVTLTHPELWNLDDPNLYRTVSEIVCNGQILDAETNTFGIRDAHFEAATGFWLNGKNFKIKGVCLHADGGAFGAAVPLEVWRQRLAGLKKLGVNAIRTAHNPPAPEFLDLCDQMGLLVMDEFFDCWTVGKNPYDYHLYFEKWSHADERDTILRDRNHPSIIIYSVGNEIHDTPHAELAKRILKGLVEVAHAADPTRPVTMALFRPNVSHDYDDGLADMLDVVGQNYREPEILAAHEQKPSRKILGTENTHERQQWIALRDNPPYAGQFLWTGVDYLGEARHWPVVGHSSGLLDRTGRPRPVAFQRQSWWSDQPMVYLTRRVARSDVMPTDPGYGGEERYTQVLFPDWTPPNPAPHTEKVEVYSNCQAVELFLNGKSLGSQSIHTDASPRVWNVTYEPGTLQAIGREDGRAVATNELHTAGRPAKLMLSTTTRQLAPGWDQVAAVRARVTDANGVEIPNASDLVSFHVSGPGKVVAVDNGDNASHEPFQASERRAYGGECVAFIRTSTASGKITVTASAPGLADGSVVINTTP
jgi:beta-galactosidase